MKEAKLFRRVRFWSLLLTALVFPVSRAAFSQTVPSEFLSGLNWRLIGPFRAGRAVAVSGVPGDDKVFYFGAVDGGIWKTTDAGTIWFPIFDSAPVASIGAIAVAPSDPNVIYAGTGESDIRSNLASGDGVYKSTDAGRTWRNIGLRDSRQISRIVVDPQNADLVYVGVLGHAYGPNAERGVYRSSDGGATWKHVLDRGPDVGVSDLAIASGNPRVLFAGTWNAHRPPWSTYGPIQGPGSGIFRSTDAGESWTQLSGHGLPDGDWGRVGVAVSADAKRVYALISAQAPGLYRSDDGGDNWVLENSDERLTARSWYFDSVTVDPNNADKLYVPNIALYESDDGGKTIFVLRGAPGGDDYHQLWIDSTNSTRMLLGSDQGTSVSLDAGKSWTSWYNQPTAQLYHVITDDQFPYLVYGAQQDSGAVAVPSRTDHFVIAPRDWIGLSASEGGYLAPDPKYPNIIYDTDAYGTVERFDRRTSLSQNITPWAVLPLSSSPSTAWGPVADAPISERKYRDPWTPVLLFSPVDKKTLYLGTQYVMSTIDGGLHWNRISADLTGAVAEKRKEPGPPTPENARERGYGVVTTIAPSPLKQEILWAGSDTGLIHLTQDGGRNWKNVTPAGLTKWSNVSLIEASHFNPGTAYAAIDRHEMDDYQPYLYRTRDFGQTWEKIDTGIAPASFARVIREDPKKKGLLFAGTEFGIYVSFDDGDHWQSLQLNLPVSSVRDLQIHGDDLVVATHGRSFWILDDMEPLRELHDAMDCVVACFFHPGAAVRVDNNSFAGTPLEPEEPTARNPPDGAVFDYYLSKSQDEVTLAIYRDQHQLIRRFSSTDPEAHKHAPMAIAERWFPKPERIENAAGIHRFVWDLRWRNSGDADVDKDSENAIAPAGPRVPPGTYEVRLTVGAKSFTHTLTVKMDPRSSASASVLAEQYRLGKEMFEQTLASRSALAEINSVQSELDHLERESVEKQAALKAQVEDLQMLMHHIVEGDGKKLPEVDGLGAANSALDTTLNAVEGGNRTTPASVLELYQQSRREAKAQIAVWAAVKKTKLATLNASLQQAGLSPIAISSIEEEVEMLRAR
jgi:photosystem II stability/assembly factor-like uncharacterized protein